MATALAYGCACLGGTRREAEWLLGHLLGWSLAQLIVRSETLLTTDQQQHYEMLLTRRAHGEPLAYLLGRWEFWSLDLVVTPAVLIPRPETELLVEAALTRIPQGVAWEIADLGTGSGAVALAIATERPTCQVTATDDCAQALAVASANVGRLGRTNVTPRVGSWCAPLLGKRFQVMVSNPPYLMTDDPHLSDLRFEPALALVAGSDGLAALRVITREAYACLYPGGCLLLEHGYDQGEAVRQLLRASHYEAVETLRDLEGRERVTLGVVPVV